MRAIVVQSLSDGVPSIITVPSRIFMVKRQRRVADGSGSSCGADVIRTSDAGGSSLRARTGVAGDDDCTDSMSAIEDVSLASARSANMRCSVVRALLAW